MAFTKLTSDLNIIAALSDEPNDSDGLTAAQLKAKFDEAAGIIKTFLNGSLISELEGEGGAANIGISDDNCPEFVGYSTVQQALELVLSIAKQAVAGTLADHSVENDKLSRKTDSGGAAVKAENIGAGEVGATELAASAATTPKIADAAVTPAKTSFLGSSATDALVLKSGVHYFASSGDLPNDAVTGQLAFVKV